MRRIAFCPYVLTPAADGGAAPRRGALLRLCDDEEGWTGYADCHPWPELGDPPLDLLLQRWDSYRGHRLAAGALACAAADGRARAQGRALLDDALPLCNHWLCADLRRLTVGRLAALRRQGFTHVKVKVGSAAAAAAVASALRPLIEAEAGDGAWRWRLDCNCRLTADEARRFFGELAPLAAHLDFIEDPSPYDPLLWHELQRRSAIAIANDNATTLAQAIADGFRVLVVKPALVTEEELLPYAALPLRWVFTSYLGHPLGQLAAWHRASLWYRRCRGTSPVCGLASHHVYESGPFAAALGLGPYMTAPGGAGLGYGSLLEALPWQR